MRDEEDNPLLIIAEAKARKEQAQSHFQHLDEHFRTLIARNAPTETVRCAFLFRDVAETCLAIITSDYYDLLDRYARGSA